MQEPPLTWPDWMKRIQEFKAGAPGVAVVVITLLVTAYFAFQPEIFFRSGRYPRLVLILPALLLGLLTFLGASAVTWRMHKARRR